jgi:hypothetical protein
MIEGCFSELNDWPDLPIICDNNLLAASEQHTDKVFDRLEKFEGVDFNQGLDIRMLNGFHIERLARLKNPKIRLACDSLNDLPRWEVCAERLMEEGLIPKRSIYTYALIGWSDTPEEAWERCEFIRKKTKYTCPMWFHELDAMKRNQITEVQKDNGWDYEEMKAIMGFYYKHRGQPRYV